MDLCLFAATEGQTSGKETKINGSICERHVSLPAEAIGWEVVSDYRRNAN